ncbi:hypothetical protein RCJ22_20385 [Vibrio sp. FNV 38]|nr:hypothetical protein [Vibrio sp. FNV 38]
MFVAISIVISLSIVLSLWFYAKKSNNGFERKYQLVMDLRSVLILCRQHRSLTHNAKVHQQLDEKMVDAVEHRLLDIVQHLVVTAQFENKPLYRVLEIKVNAMLKQWRDQSVAKNQMVHGKVIRHCVYLLDDVMLAWLAQAGRDDLYEKYHMNWQAVLDSMETLTQLRISIQDCDTLTPNSEERIRYYCGSVINKVNRLNAMNREVATTPQSMIALSRLDDISHGYATLTNTNSLYSLSSEVSSAISDVYDEMLKSFAEELYQPLDTPSPVTSESLQA